MKKIKKILFAVSILTLGIVTTGCTNTPSSNNESIGEKIELGNITFESKTFTFDGKVHSLEVTGLPTGVNATYENNDKINAGSYEVVAKLEDTTGNYIVPEELKSTLKINKKDLTNDLTIESKEFTYDGNAHSLEVTGLPEGVNVLYENNDKINAGSYEVKAKLEDTTGNYIVPSELKSTLKINNKDITNDLVFESKEFTYDGNTHSLEVTNVPEGVNVLYENNDKINAGSYEVIAKLEDTTGNFIVPEELIATLKINKKDITNDLVFESKEFTYDGNAHSLEATGLPEGVNVSYENNDKINAGSYEVIAKLEDTTGNYIVPEELKASLKINKKDITNDISFESKEITYDGNTHSLEVTGLPEGVNVLYENNGKVNAGSYEVKAKLDDTTGNYIIPNELKSTLKINKIDLTNDIIFNSKEITYDGNSHQLEVTGLPEGVNITYENNSNINVGEYEVIAKLEDTTGNYIVPAELKANLKINKIVIELVNNNINLNYTNDELSVTPVFTGALNSVAVNYELEMEDSIIKEAKTYLIKVKILNDIYELKDDNLTVIVTKELFKITFKAEGYDDVSYDVYFGDDFSLEADPFTKVGYNLVFDTDLDTLKDIRENKTVNVSFAAKKFNITYNYAFDDTEDNKIEVEYDSNVSLPYITRPGYSFIGYKNPETNTLLSYSFKFIYLNDIKLYGVYAFDYTYTVNANNTMTLTGLSSNGENKTNLSIPQYGYTWNNYVATKYTITSIADAAFKNNTKIVYISIPSTIKSIGSNAFYGCKNVSEIYYDAPNITNSNTSNVLSNIGSSVYETSGLKLTIGPNVESLPNYMFSNDYLTSIDASNAPSLKKIGVYSFNNSLYLVNVKLSNSIEEIGEYAFYGCKKADFDMSKLTNLKSIGQYAFYNCYELPYIYICNAVTSIGKNAFNNCKNVSEIYYDAKNIVNSSTNVILNYLGESVYQTEGLKLIIGENATVIPDYFMGTDGIVANSCYLTSLDASNATSLKKIGSYAFNYASYLENVKLNSALEEIGEYAFNNCKNMNLDMSNLYLLKTIGQYAFYKCSGITNIYIYEYVTTLGKNAFFGCSNVNEIFYDGSITNASTATVLGSIGENVYLNNGLKLIIGETAKEIPAYFMDEGYLTSIDASNAKSLEKIGEYAFNNCTNLTDVKLPSNLEKIGNYVFNNCKLMNMDFSLLVNLTAIGEHAFYGCDKLTNVYIGENVTSIGISAFNSCDSITSIVFDAIKCNDGIKKMVFSGSGNNIVLTVGKKVQVITNSLFAQSNIKTLELSNADALKIIEDGAFEACSVLNTITLAKNLEEIGSNAFYYCQSLTTVSLSNTVKTIDDGAFNASSKITTVYYYGTSAEWDLISIGSQNTYLKNATRIYS
ncbi:MAG: leucine-rich repeat domain-containing protein [Acholeplasmatales bacterium]|nr:leucine-rich repeat domain-containing protein [Acholeplasmatales bacterium]